MIPVEKSHFEDAALQGPEATLGAVGVHVLGHAVAKSLVGLRVLDSEGTGR